jgi:septal ring factor EnvC (AmiA/AmiB activator)
VTVALRRRGARWLLAAVVAALWCSAALLPGPPAAAAEGDAADSAELRQIRGEIERLQSDLEQVRQRRQGLEGRIEEINVELSLQRQRMAEARAAFAAAQAAVGEVQARVEALEDDLAAARRELRGRLTGLYRMGRHGYLRLLLAANPEGDLLPALRLSRFLARRDREAVGRYERVGRELEGEQSALLLRQQEAASWSEREVQRRQELTELRGRQHSLLAQLERERQRLAAQALDLADRERAVAALFDDLGDRASLLSGSPIQQFRGALGWPVEGEVTISFGTRLDLRYKTRVPHNGIEIQPLRPGDPVRAVYPGKVLYAAPFQGYGPTVVMHHAGRVFTLYAGLAELKVGRNDVVALGQELGPVADRLYFEIRAGSEALDPLDWLR